jgi:hypothetical protein
MYRYVYDLIRTKFHTSMSHGSLIISIGLNAKEYFHTTAKLFYIIKKNGRTKMAFF